MRILETHAKNEKEAIDLACQYLSVDAEHIELQLHEKGSSGFLGLGEKQPSVYYINAIEDKTPLQVVIKGVIATILHKMGYKAKFVRFETLEDSDKLYVELASPHAGYIIGKKGRTLESLQFLVNLLVEQYTKKQPKILLDIENYRARRAKHLEDLAKKTASHVARSGRSKLLDPLNPYERRLIHMALQEDSRVGTESEGDGVYKRVRIFQVKSGKEDRQPRRRDDDSIPEHISTGYSEDPDTPTVTSDDWQDADQPTVNPEEIQDPDAPTIKPVESSMQDQDR